MQQRRSLATTLRDDDLPHTRTVATRRRPGTMPSDADRLGERGFFMSSVLTCDCGARFEVNAFGPGQSICCPECLQSLQPAVPASAPPRTSWLALASLALALVGAFTVVGSLAAAALGAAALIHLRRNAGRLTGAAFALSALALGLAMTALTLALFSSQNVPPIGAWLRGRTLTGQVEPPGTPVVSSRDDACLLTLPSADWLRVKAGVSGDPSVEDLQQKRDTLLVNVRLRAYADVTVDPSDAPSASDYQFYLAKDLQPTRPPLVGGDDDPRPPPAPHFRDARPFALEGHDAYEWLLDLDRGGRTWRFLVRAYRRKPGKEVRSVPFYVVRVYAPRGTFAAHEEELRSLLDSVRFPR